MVVHQKFQKKLKKWKNSPKMGVFDPKTGNFFFPIFFSVLPLELEGHNICYWNFGGTIVEIIDFFGGSVVIYWRFLRGVAPKKYSIKHYRPNKKINNFHYCPVQNFNDIFIWFWRDSLTMHPSLRQIVGIISRKGGCIVRIIPTKIE